MKFISVILLICVSSLCYSQKYDYHLLFPFLYYPDSIVKDNVHTIVIEHYSHRKNWKNLKNPGTIYTYKFNDSGNLESISQLISGATQSDFIFQIDPDTNNHSQGERILWNENKMIIERTTRQVKEYYKYDSVNRLSEFKVILSQVEGEDYSQVDRYSYDSLGNLNYIFSSGGGIEYNWKTSQWDTIKKYSSQTNVIYDKGEIVRIDNCINCLNSIKPISVFNYTYLNKRSWQVELFSNESNEILDVWKIFLYD